MRFVFKGLIFKISPFSPHSIRLCKWLPEPIAIISLTNSNRLAFVVEKERVFSAVGTEVLIRPSYITKKK
jgi:hypothetical protein